MESGFRFRVVGLHIGIVSFLTVVIPFIFQEILCVRAGVDGSDQIPHRFLLLQNLGGGCPSLSQTVQIPLCPGKSFGQGFSVLPRLFKLCLGKLFLYRRFGFRGGLSHCTS